MHKGKNSREAIMATIRMPVTSKLSRVSKEPVIPMVVRRMARMDLHSEAVTSPAIALAVVLPIVAANKDRDRTDGKATDQL